MPPPWLFTPYVATLFYDTLSLMMNAFFRRLMPDVCCRHRLSSLSRCFRYCAIRCSIDIDAACRCLGCRHYLRRCRWLPLLIILMFRLFAIDAAACLLYVTMLFADCRCRFRGFSFADIFTLRFARFVTIRTRLSTPRFSLLHVIRRHYIRYATTAAAAFMMTFYADVRRCHFHIFAAFDFAAAAFRA